MMGMLFPMSHSSSSSEPQSTLRIGVIGSGGRIRQVLGQTLASDRALKITAVFDPDAGAVAELKAKLAPDAKVHDSAKSLCESADVDWVFIGSWNCLHAEHACAAFAAGKHVFCEKPLALTVDEARAMHAAWKASGRTFALGLVLRYSPLYRKAKELLDQGAIGRLISFEFNETLTFNHGGYIHGNWRRKRELAGTHLLEKCCHDLDLMYWLTGAKPMRVASFGGCNFFRPENAHHTERIGPSPENGRPAYRTWPNPHGIDPFNTDKDIVDNQVAILEAADGVRATFHTNCHAAQNERRFYMLGTEGSLRFDLVQGRIEHVRIGWNQPTTVHAVNQSGGHAGSDEVMARELAEVMRGKRLPAAGFAEGVRSLAISNAIDQAMDEGRIVDLAPTWSQLESEFGPLF